MFQVERKNKSDIICHISLPLTSGASEKKPKKTNTLKVFLDKLHQRNKLQKNEINRVSVFATNL